MHLCCLCAYVSVHNVCGYVHDSMCKHNHTYLRMSVVSHQGVTCQIFPEISFLAVVNRPMYVLETELGFCAGAVCYLTSELSLQSSLQL